jgi:ABC-2 type transport system permease protein
MGQGMKAVSTLFRYHLVILARNPGYWVVSLILAALGIIAFGYLVSNPTTPRLGIVDEAGNALSRDFVERTRDIEAFHLSVGSREDQLEKLRDGDRWSVLILPAGFGTEEVGGSVELLTGQGSDYSAFTGSGIIRQLLSATADGSTSQGGFEIAERSLAGERPPRFIDFVVPGQIGLSIMFGNLFATGLIAWWRQEGALKRLAAAPIAPWQLMAAQLMVFGLLSIMQATILLALGWLLFDVTVRGSLLALGVTIVAGILAFLTLWYAIVAFVRSAQAVNGLSNLIAVVMIFVGGSYLPVEDPPVFLKPLTVLAPLKYLNDALREIISQGHGLSDIWPELTVLLTWAGGLAYISTRVFRWTTE